MMSKLNRSLVMSIVSDIKESVRVAEEMHSRLGRIDYPSWRFPTQAAPEAEGTKENEKDMPRGKVSRGSQASVGNVGNVADLADVADVSGCESCSLASRAIHRPINAIKAAYQQNKLISTAAQERESVRAEIYENTQWSAMRRLTEAIGRDVNLALAMARRNKAKRERTARNYGVVRGLRDELTEKRKDLERLNAAHLQYAERLENVSENLKKLQEEHSEVQRENRKLLISIEEIRKGMQSLVEGNNALRGQTATLAESKFVLERTVEQVRAENSRSKMANRKTELAMQLRLKNIQGEKYMIKLKLEEKTMALEREITELRSVAINEEMEKKPVKDCREDRRDDCQEETILMPGDNPEVDMTRQLISNRQKIQLLSRQNQRLERTLSRLQKYRTMEDPPSTSNY